VDLDDTKHRVDELLTSLFDNSRRIPSTGTTSIRRPPTVTARLVSDELEDAKSRVDRMLRKLAEPVIPAPVLFPSIYATSTETSTTSVLTTHSDHHHIPRQDSISLVDPLNFLENDVPPQELRCNEIPDVPSKPPVVDYASHNELTIRGMITERMRQQESLRVHKRNRPTIAVPASQLEDDGASYDEDDESPRKRQREEEGIATRSVSV